MAKNTGVISFGALDTNVESRLGFKPEATIDNGICLGKIISVELKEHDVPKLDDQGVPSAWEFAGLKTTSIEITYKQINKVSTDMSERFITQRETIVSAGKKDGSAVTVDNWTNMILNQFERLQHIANVLDKGMIKPLSKKIGAVDLKYDDSAEIRISKMKKLYEHFYTQITGLPVKVAEGAEAGVPRFTNVPLWIKVIAESTKGTYYVIPNYVGKGFLEVVKTGLPTYLELAASETIELSKSTKQEKGAAKPDLNYTDKDAVQGSNTPKSAADVLKGLNIG